VKRTLLPLAAGCLLAAAGVAAEPVSQRLHQRQGPAPSQPMTTSTLGQQTSHAQAFTKPFAPTGLTTTTDAQVCTQHGGFGAGLACKALLAQGRLVLIWNYANGPLPAAGFRVYRVDGGTRTRVDAQAITPDLKIFIVDPPPPGGYAGACYAVSAYASGGQESDLTPEICGDGQMLAQTATFSPTQWRSIARRRMKSGGLAPDEFNDDFNAAEATT
jgi:hypothetical protein